MAKKTISSKRKQVKRRNATKSAFPKILIGAGVIGGGYLLYKYVLKPYMQGGQDSTQDLTGAVAPIDQQIQNVIGSADATTVNIPSAGAGTTFSPLGTTWDKLNKIAPIMYGSKGQEVLTMQKLMNDIAKAKGWTTRVTVDGVFGPNTWNLHKVLSFKGQNLDWWYNEKLKAENLAGFTTITGIQ
jgi:hypothetical protein